MSKDFTPGEAAKPATISPVTIAVTQMSLLLTPKIDFLSLNNDNSL
jgi:hypothetical protein